MTEVIAVPIPPNGKIEIPVGEFRVLQLKPQDPETRKLFPAFVERCLAFIEVTHADTDPLWLCNLIFYNAYHNTNYIHCLVALNERDEIRAHAFSYLDTSHKLGTHVFILQIWKNEGPSDIIDRGMKMVEEYARETKSKHIVYNADSLAKLRLYQRWGFQLHRIYGIKEVL